MRTPSDHVPTSTSKRIVLAHVASAHGIRGDLVVRAYTGDPQALADYGPLTDAGGKRRFEITSLRMTSKGVIVHFKGVDDRNAAEALRGQELYVERAALPPVEDGSYYHVDLIGLRAISPEGETLGVVVAIPNFGAGELLEIKPPNGDETFYVPFTDTFVPTVDITAGHAIVVAAAMVGDPEPATESDNETDANSRS